MVDAVRGSADPLQSARPGVRHRRRRRARRLGQRVLGHRGLVPRGLILHDVTWGKGLGPALVSPMTQGRHPQPMAQYIFRDCTGNADVDRDQSDHLRDPRPAPGDPTSHHPAHRTSVSRSGSTTHSRPVDQLAQVDDDQRAIRLVDSKIEVCISDLWIDLRPVAMFRGSHAPRRRPPTSTSRPCGRWASASSSAY